MQFATQTGNIETHVYFDRPSNLRRSEKDFERQWVGLAAFPFLAQATPMDFDDQMHRYFGTSKLESIEPEALIAGIEHMKVDLGLTRDRGQRFALWALLYTLGSTPDLDVVFEREQDREAARNFMDIIHGAQSR